MSLVYDIQTLIKNNFSEYTYLKTSSKAEADLKLTQESTHNQPVIIFYNLPEITVEQGVSNLEEVYPIRILFGYHADIDADSDRVDTILETCKDMADKFWDVLLQTDAFQKVVNAKQGDNVYNLIPSTYEGFENIIGYELQTDIRIHRSTQTLLD